KFQLVLQISKSLSSLTPTPGQPWTHDHRKPGCEREQITQFPPLRAYFPRVIA
ncbi:hypothetical protein J6590_095361, partial [Homalodisca vitripennis]